MSAALLKHEGGGRFRLEGDVTFDTVPAVLENARELLAGGAEIELDWGGVGQVDSSAVALMLEWMRRAQAAGRTIRFRGLPESMRAIVDVSDLSGLIPVGD